MEKTKKTKKMNKMWTIGLALMVLAVSMVFAVPFGAGRFDSETKEEIADALENDDFDAWKEAMSSGLTQESFEKMQEWHERMSAKIEAKEAVKDALDNADYDAWLEAIAGLPMEEKFTEYINEDNFDELVAAHVARQEGDHETAKEIMEELGIPLGGLKKMHQKHFGQGQGRGIENGQGKGMNQGMQNGQGMGPMN